ncbi:MAG: hypothetical protein CL386_05040 [Acidiferrobacter sp.]|jgi:RND family efflux transporter MFP subunit|nr:hypothetical protein [Acidiferrobacter sp.]
MKNGFRILLLGLLSLTTGTLIADTFDAVVDWNRRVEIGFGMSGQVKAVEVGPGDAVAAGAVLVSLDTVLLEIAVRKASNTEAISEAQMERQLAVVEREQTLYDEGALSAVQLEKVELDLSRTEFAFNDAQLEHRRARHLLELATLTAPFDAWVVDSGFMPGQFVHHQADSPVLMTLAERGRYLAKAEVDGTAVERLTDSPDIEIRLGDKTFEALQSRIGLEPIADGNDGQRYLLSVQFESDGLIRPGTSCTVLVP